MEGRVSRMPLCYRWGNWDLEFCEELSSLQIQLLDCARNSLKLSQCKVSKESFWVFQYPYHIRTSDIAKSSFIVIIMGLKNLWKRPLKFLSFPFFFYLKLHDIIMKNILKTMQGSPLLTPLPFCPLHLCYLTHAFGRGSESFWKLHRQCLVIVNSQHPVQYLAFSFPFPFFFFLSNKHWKNKDLLEWL